MDQTAEVTIKFLFPKNGRITTQISNWPNEKYFEMYNLIWLMR